MFRFGVNLIPTKLNYFSLYQKFALRNFLTYNRINQIKTINRLPEINMKVQKLSLNCGNNILQIQKKEMRSAKTKRKLKLPDTTYKMKTKNAARKRFRVIGKLFDKHFRHWPNNKRHKMLNKSSNNLKRKKSERYVHTTNMRHLKRLFPYFKRKKYRN